MNRTSKGQHYPDSYKYLSLPFYIQTLTNIKRTVISYACVIDVMFKLDIVPAYPLEALACSKQSQSFSSWTLIKMIQNISMTFKKKNLNNNHLNLVSVISPSRSSVLCAWQLTALFLGLFGSFLL